MNSVKFSGLDGIRGIAALLVVWWHAGSMLHRWAPPSSYLCVDLFFMLSGFVVAYAYEQRLTSDLSILRFVEIRVIRLYPLYILGCAISLFPYLWGAIFNHQHWRIREPLKWFFPWALLMIPRPSLSLGRSFLLNPPAWSLFLELVINIAYAFVLPLLSNYRLVLIVIVSGITLAIATGRYGSGDFGTGGPQMLWALARVTCPFAIGVLLFRRSQMRRLPLAGAPAWVPLALFAGFVLCPVPPALAGLIIPALVIGGATLIVVIAAGIRPGPATARLADAAGTLSYPLYALHLPILIASEQLLEPHGVGAGVAVPIGIVAALVSASFAGRWYDRPLRAWMTRRLSLRRARVQAPAL